MSRRSKLLICFSCAVLAAVLIVQLTRQREPTYKGRTLSQWLAPFQLRFRGPPRHISGATVREAQEAVRQIGTNALPVLLEWIRRDPAPWSERWAALAAKLPAPIATSSLLSRFAMTPDDRANGAINGFFFLGTNAFPAIPELTSLALDSSRHKASRNAMWILVRLGPDVIPALNAVLTDPKARADQKITILANIPSFGMDARPAVPAIIQCLKDKNAGVRQDAIIALITLGLESALVVLALTTCLNDPSSSIRLRAAVALVQFGIDPRLASDPYTPTNAPVPVRENP